MIFWLVLKLEISYRLIIKLSVKLSKLRVLTLSWAKTQDVVKKSRWVENKGKKLQGETQKCTNFDASSSFTLSFFVSFSCALTIGFSFLMGLDKVATLSTSEKCFKLQVWRFKLWMWGVEFLSERWLLWMINAWSCKLQVWGVKFLSERVSGLNVESLN